MDPIFKEFTLTFLLLSLYNWTLNIKRTGLVCIGTSSVVPVSNLYRHVLKVLAEASYERRTIWVKAKMPGF